VHAIETTAVVFVTQQDPIRVRHCVANRQQEPNAALNACSTIGR
jgi:hypothetical protein